MATDDKIYAVFAGAELIGRGPLREVFPRAQALVANAGEEPARIAVYEDDTGRVVEIDFARESADEALARLAGGQEGAVAPPRRGPGRPKLGVVCREVSLLPRHWQWLAEQGGASATLRRLVEAARRREAPEATRRRAIEAAHGFLWDLAGDLPGFEEVTRSLYAGDFERLEAMVAPWPAGIRDQLGRYVARARAATA